MNCVSIICLIQSCTYYKLCNIYLCVCRIGSSYVILVCFECSEILFHVLFSMHIVTWLRTGGQNNQDGGRDFPDPILRPHCHWGSPSLCSNWYKGSFPGKKRPGREACHAAASTVEFKNALRCIFPHNFTRKCLIRHEVFSLFRRVYIWKATTSFVMSVSPVILL